MPTVSQAGPGQRKLPTVITAAIARELAGFIWAIAKQGQPTTPTRTAETDNGNCRKEHSHTNATIHPLLGKAGGTVTARRTLEDTISRISSDAGH